MVFSPNYQKRYRNPRPNQSRNQGRKSGWFDRKSDRHVQIIALLFISGFFLMLIFGTPTLLTWIKISQIYAAFAVVLSFIPIKILPIVYRIRKELKVLLSIFGLAPFLTGVLLMLNFTITTKQWENSVKITSYHYNFADHKLQIITESADINKHYEACSFYLEATNFEPDSATFVIRKGIFGFSILHDKRLVSK